MLQLARDTLRPLAIKRSTWRKAPGLTPAVVEGAARVGYGVRGLLYLAVGLITLSAVLFRSINATSPTGALGWLAQQPFSWIWLLIASLGLLAFFGWRILQGVFDIDRAGLSRDALSMRLSQTCSAFGYAILSWAALSLAFHSPSDPELSEVQRTHRHAEQILSLPHGEWLLAGIAVAVAGVGIGNVSRAWRENFTDRLSCSEAVCRWLSPLARAGYLARGLAYLPLAAFIALAAVRSSPEDVTSLGGALNALVADPIGRVALSLAGGGFVAFGLFSLVEARFRKFSFTSGRLF